MNEDDEEELSLEDTMAVGVTKFNRKPDRYLATSSSLRRLFRHSEYLWVIVNIAQAAVFEENEPCVLPFPPIQRAGVPCKAQSGSRRLVAPRQVHLIS